MFPGTEPYKRVVPTLLGRQNRGQCGGWGRLVNQSGEAMPKPLRRLIIATANPGKVRELQALLSDLPIELLGAEGMPEVEETGTTFADNAELKARAAAAWSHEWSLADDSGLEVDALQ